jgi:hypothetical protein
LKDFDENPSLNFKMGQLACESRSISGKYEHLLKLFLKSKKDRSPMKIDQFLNFKMGQVTRKNRQISRKHGHLLKFFLKSEKGRSLMKIDQFLNFKMG